MVKHNTRRRALRGPAARHEGNWSKGCQHKEPKTLMPVFQFRLTSEPRLYMRVAANGRLCVGAPVTKPQLVPDPVPPPTTPSLIRVYELPTEDLFNVSYQSTANHYWVFTHGTPWITDLAPEANFLSEELFDRYSKYDQKLTTSPYKEDFDQSPPSLLKTLNSIDEFVGESQLAGGLFTEDTRSVWLGRDLSRPCFRLVADLAQERKYFRDCLLDPEACDYGLSASVWVYFNSLAASGRETLLSTAPQGEAGFSMFIKNEILTVELSGSQRSWVCSVTVSIETRSWNNIGFTWRSYTGDISVILNNEVLRTCTGSSSESINGLPKAPPTSLWLGCSSDGEFGDPETGVEDAYLTHPALWYWPLQLHVLFLGSKADRSNAPTGLPQDDSKPTDQKVDYTTLVEEYQPQNWSQLPANPYYVTADGFFEFTASPNTTRGQDVEYIPTNCRNRGSYKLNTSEAFYKVKDAVKDTCPTNFAKCQNGFSIGAWVMVPASLRPTNKYLTLFEVFGQVKIVLFGDFLHVFVSDGERWQVTRLVMEVVRDEFFNLGFSLSGEPTKLATGFINGLPQTTMAFAAQSMESTEVHEGVVSGDILIGSGAVGNTTSGVVISDLVYWTRITLAEEGHRFIGYTPAQLRLLSQSDRYWSVDAYLLHDAPCHAAYEKKRYGETDADSPTPNFKLVSVYKPRGVQPVRFIPDQNEQSPTPILSMRKTDYFMLGEDAKTRIKQDCLSVTVSLKPSYLLVNHADS
ncbi:unnamed protein product [Mesocestoides corti]|uniref:Uncharacterized protein n=1 Tax=Mesocestoides corti TaxID=53468 RepID=A0A0R3U9W8_MESCO|nr:unnamed protein product [Mesocestoides corti]